MNNDVTIGDKVKLTRQDGTARGVVVAKTDSFARVVNARNEQLPFDEWLPFTSKCQRLEKMGGEG